MRENTFPHCFILKKGKKAMKILKKQREQFNKIIELVHALTLAVHTENREEYEHTLEKLKEVIQ